MRVVEARKLAHEVVEAAHRGREIAQREQSGRARAARPQEQGQVREIAALPEYLRDVVQGSTRQRYLASSPISLSRKVTGTGNP